MKIISFSLWGNNPVYTIGAIKNTDIALKLFPDWKCIFYCFDSVPLNIINELKKRPNVIIRNVNNFGNNIGMFNRFYPAEEEVERMICRDTDSRLSPREVLAVNDWINQKTDFHIMRDHPYHGIPILGGMWGVVGNKLNGLTEAIKNFNPTTDKGQDQQFLLSWVWPKILQEKLSVTTHDPFFQGFPFPKECKRGKENNNVFFVGQVFDENDKYNSQSDLDMIKELI